MIRTSVCAERFSAEQAVLRSSAILACLGGDEVDGTVLSNSVDAAMYRAKRVRRNCIEQTL